MYIDTSADTRICLNADNADTATKLKTARTIGLTGDLSGSASFDGGSSITINASVVPKYAGSDSKGGAASTVKDWGTGDSDTARHVWFSYNGDDTKKVSNDKFKYNPATNKLTVGSITGSSASCTGNAATASKLATARTISLGGNLSGSTSFDGSSNITISGQVNKLATVRNVSGGTDITLSFDYDGSRNSIANIGYYRCGSRLNNTNNYPYHRFARIDETPNAYTDFATTFYISKDYNGGGFGIVTLSLRTNNKNTVSQAEVKWLVRSGLPVDCLQVGLYNVFEHTYADAFFKHDEGGWDNVTIRAVASGQRGSIKRTWILNDSNEANNTTPTDKLTSTEVYASISEAATELHGQAYTDIITAQDDGIVKTASQVDWSGIQNQPNYAGSTSKGGSANSAAKLDSSAGSATQPIYFSSGKPVACSYTLAKSVPSDAKFTDTVYSLPTAGSTLGGVKTTSTVTNASGYTACPIIGGVPYYKDTNTTYSLSSFGISASAAEINYTKGVTSAIQTQLNGKVPTSRTVNGKALSSNISLSYGDVGAAAANHSHSYLPLSGGTVTGPVSITNTTAASSTTTGALKVSGGIGCAGNIYGTKVYGAVWNDYAEYRISDCLEPGRVVCEIGDDTLSISTRRLQPGANIVTDTYGFSIGETAEAQCPIAVSGRVLAYGYEDRDEFRKNIGHPVCAGPNGTVSIMTDEEYIKYGYCAIGTISAVPNYEEWGTEKVKVNNRIWIKV